MKKLLLLCVLVQACGSSTPTQLIQNGSFEEFDLMRENTNQMIPYWTPVKCGFNETGSIPTNSAAYDGEASLELIGEDCGAVSRSYALPADTSWYELKLASWSSDAQEGILGCAGECVRVMIQWYVLGSGWNKAAYNHVVSNSEDPSVTWEVAQFQNYVPPEATHVRVEFRHLSSTPTRVDSVELWVR